jgi:hypothetical protein
MKTAAADRIMFCVSGSFTVRCGQKKWNPNRPNAPVIPAKAGIQQRSRKLDSRFRGNDKLHGVNIESCLIAAFKRHMAGSSKVRKHH